jgi:hypothetical protein
MDGCHVSRSLRNSVEDSRARGRLQAAGFLSLIGLDAVRSLADDEGVAAEGVCPLMLLFISLQNPQSHDHMRGFSMEQDTTGPALSGCIFRRLNKRCQEQTDSNKASSFRSTMGKPTFTVHGHFCRALYFERTAKSFFVVCFYRTKSKEKRTTKVLFAMHFLSRTVKYFCPPFPFRISEISLFLKNFVVRSVPNS